jgi:hypothetical protein
MSHSEKLDWETKLAALAPEARKRVEEILAKGIESELASEAVNPELRAAEFSRGWFFSRAKPMLDTTLEEEMLRGSVSMSEEAFSKFAQRLATLKSLKDTGR